jgi:hypothetical protein
MSIVYFIIIISVLLAWGSSRINTDTFLKIFGMGLIILGCLIHIAGKNNNFIEYGVICYFACELLNAYLRKERKHEAKTN